MNDDEWQPPLTMDENYRHIEELKNNSGYGKLQDPILVFIQEVLDLSKSKTIKNDLQRNMITWYNRNLGGSEKEKNSRYHNIKRYYRTYNEKQDQTSNNGDLPISYNGSIERLKRITTDPFPIKQYDGTHLWQVSAVQSVLHHPPKRQKIEKPQKKTDSSLPDVIDLNRTHPCDDSLENLLNYDKHTCDDSLENLLKCGNDEPGEAPDQFKSPFKSPFKICLEWLQQTLIQPTVFVDTFIKTPMLP